MQWETETQPQPCSRSVINFADGDGAIVVTTDPDGSVYQHIRLHIIEESDESRDSACVTCPDMLIAKARAALDDFEAELKEEPCETP